MGTHHIDGASAPGLAAPELAASDNARGQAGVIEGEGTADKADFATGAPQSAQALRVLVGERKAAEFLDRLHAQQATSDELALIVAALYGAELRGLCAVITKALRGGV